MREQSRLEVAEQLNLSKATMHLGDALAPLLRRKILAAPSPRQLAIAFALTEECNEEPIAALGRTTTTRAATTSSRSCPTSSTTKACRSWP